MPSQSLFFAHPRDRSLRIVCHRRHRRDNRHRTLIPCGCEWLVHSQGPLLEVLQYARSGLLSRCPADELARFGRSEIFNTDQGARLTSAEFIATLKAHPVRISLDGRGRWRDDVFAELWRSIKYEDVCLHDDNTVNEARSGLARYITFFNTRRAVCRT